MRAFGTLAALTLLGAAPTHTASAVLAPALAPGPETMAFVSVRSDVLVLANVRIVDGTGAPAQAGRTIVIRNGSIAEIGGSEILRPAGARVLDLTGRTVLPGIVGMHDHLFYIARPNLSDEGTSEPPLLVPQMTFSAPRLYLAAGVTTIRTTGSVEPYADLNLKRLIDRGLMPGPRMDATTPYLEGGGGRFIQMNQLEGPAQARAFVRYWAAQGATSVKAYISITRGELRAGIEEAHRLGLKVTGHLCSVTYAQAVELGIDNVEHGFFTDTADDPGREPDRCPASAGAPTLQRRAADLRLADPLIRLLVRKRVALTSTLAVFEQLLPGAPLPDAGTMASLSPEARADFLRMREARDRATPQAAEAARLRFRGEMALERRFVAAGGLLLAGPDPTGNGGVVPGFGDVRGIELLVEAGFAPEQAIRIATLNGAIFLGVGDRIGSVAPGRLADLIVVRGDPTRNIRDLRNTEIVFKDGVGYDPVRLRSTVSGRYGRY